MAGPHPEFPTLWVWGEAQELVFLRNCQVVLMLLAQGSPLRTINPDDLGAPQYTPDLNRAALWLLVL